MNIDIVDKRLSFELYGFSGTAIGKDYAGTAFALMGRMWHIVKSHDLRHKGLNIWVSDSHERVFAGVDLEAPPKRDVGLECKQITLDRYAYVKHAGPDPLIRQRGQEMRDELGQRGLEIIPPYIERYGHWTDDETKLETELFMAIR